MKFIAASRQCNSSLLSLHGCLIFNNYRCTLENHVAQFKIINEGKRKEEDEDEEKLEILEEKKAINFKPEPNLVHSKFNVVNEEGTQTEEGKKNASHVKTCSLGKERNGSRNPRRNLTKGHFSWWITFPTI